MKKLLLSFVMAIVCVFALTACGGNDTFKVGLICLHDENSTYDKNFIDAMEVARQELGLEKSQVIIKTGVPEDNTCYAAACDLVDQGCDVIFADSFGHESFLIQAAEENPKVQFCHATGIQAHTKNLANFHNAFASINEGRYLAGVAAGLKLNAMIEAGEFTAAEAKMGFVGAWPYAEVKSGYTSFYLGAKSVCPTVTMEVRFTNSWYDETAEQNTATALINAGCKLISQHADSMGAPTACEAAGVPNVSYNGSTVEACPNTFIVSSKINWTPYYKLAIEAVKNDKASDIPTDYVGTLATGSVQLTDVNTKAAAPGTAEEIANVKAQLENGTLKVFDTNNFTVGGNKVTTYKADVDSDADFTHDTEVIINGVFEESVKRSAPYFDLDFDGITIVK